MSHPNTHLQRTAWSAETSLLTLAFLACGGTVTRLSHIERAPDRPISIHRHRPSKAAKVSAELASLERQVAEHGRALAKIGLTVIEACRQLRPHWLGKIHINTGRAEQLAARFGYAYADKGANK